MTLIFDGLPTDKTYAPISSPQHAVVTWNLGFINVGNFDRTFNAPPPPTQPPELSKYSWLFIDWDILPTGPAPGSGPFTEAGVSGNCQVYFNSVLVATLSGVWYISDTMLNNTHYYWQWHITTDWKFIALTGPLYSIRCVGAWHGFPPSIYRSELSFSAELLRSVP